MPSVVMVTPLVIVIFVFLPIFLMGALGLVLTVASRKTRPAGIGLPAVASLAVVGMVGLGVLWAGVSSPRDVPSETMSARKIITVEGRASESARGRTYAPAPPMSRSSSRTRGGFELVPEPDANDPVYGPQAGDTSPSPPPNRESASHDHPRASNTISGLRRAVARGFVETWHPGDGRKRVEATSKSSSGDGSVGFSLEYRIPIR